MKYTPTEMRLSEARRRYSTCGVCGSGAIHPETTPTTWSKAEYDPTESEWTVTGSANGEATAATVFLTADNDWHLRRLQIGSAIVAADEQIPSKSPLWVERLKLAQERRLAEEKAEAQREAERLLRAAESHLRFAKKELESRNYATARDWLIKAMQAAPDSATASEAEQLLASFPKSSGETLRMTEAEAADPKALLKASTNLNSAKRLIGNGNTQGAIPWLERAIEAAPDSEFATEARKLLKEVSE